MKALPADVLVKDWALWKHMHTGMARLHGATDEEISEVAYLASLTARWSAMIHAQNYDYEVFKREVEQVGEHLQKKMSRR